MRTERLISDWLNDLPDGHRQICINNFKESQHKDELVSSLHQAIDLGLNWQNQPQHWTYFYNLCLWASKRNKEFPLPRIPISFNDRIKSLFK